jgi:hypothetical protein
MREILGAAVAEFEMQTFLRKERGEIFEQHLVLGVFRGLEIDFADLQQGEVAFAFLGRANLARDGVAGAQVETSDLAGRHVDVVGAGEIGAVVGAQESETVGQDLEDAIAGDVFALFGVRLEYAENDVLFAGPGDALDAHFIRKIDEFGGRFLLEFGQIHRLRVACGIESRDA